MDKSRAEEIAEQELRENTDEWLRALKLDNLCQGKDFSTAAYEDISALIAFLDAKIARLESEKEKAFNAGRAGPIISRGTVDRTRWYADGYLKHDDYQQWNESQREDEQGK